MTEKLKDYQVLDVLCGGTFYKVRHKVTNSIFAWKAYNCCTFSDEQIQNVINEVKILSKELSGNFLRYYDTILHGPTKTLYFVLEYNSWQSVQELIALCKATDKHFSESFIWYLLLELARSCKVVEDFNFVALKKCISTESVFVGQNGELRINCFELSVETLNTSSLVQQVGELLRILCYRPCAGDHKIEEFHYSDDLRDVLSFITDVRNANIRPDVVLYHPTILANTETLTCPKLLSEILVSAESPILSSGANKCDSEKVVEQSRIVEPPPRTRLNVIDSPIYCNVKPEWLFEKDDENKCSQDPISPTIAALALELPGYVPRSRKPYCEVLEVYNRPQMVSQETLSQQWMSRLIALREREESLNKRERNLLSKEIVSSPTTKVVCMDDSIESCHIKSNGITLPPVFNHVSEEVKNNWVSRRRQRRSSSVRTRGRRKSYAYEDLDSSLSADNGDSSIIVTAAKITKDNMPVRKIFPDISAKKVHFGSTNPFVESDESVTLTFYELENVNSKECQVPRQEKKVVNDISKFKYLDLEKLTSEKRAAMNQGSSSPSKQAKFSNKAFTDITNNTMRKTPSKTSLSSKGSNISKSSVSSSRSLWSSDSNKVCESDKSVKNHLSDKIAYMQTPTIPPELKKSKRKSLLPFKTPFKFKTSTKV
ncbi:unnamed protein product [Euphydryas editha]|uniref:non-specific serine/threonine protein kinase n=1 Tax=Euphydryas editha TaxID=104508 RepID=A0AAU9TQQ4_EUPED|nr:unnamed protein product [Euphydryas editha]